VIPVRLHPIVWPPRSAASRQGPTEFVPPADGVRVVQSSKCCFKFNKKRNDIQKHNSRAHAASGIHFHLQWPFKTHLHAANTEQP
jgi:hypothetical protein